MVKKIMAGMFAAVFAVILAGCSGGKMTDEDLAVQRAIEGFWSADASTGYNSYDEEGMPLEIIVVEFTDDFNYYIHQCSFADNYITTYDPVSYSFKNGRFMVNVNGVPSYAKISVSGDTMQWITDGRTDIYKRMDDETARELGIPEHNGESTAEP